MARGALGLLILSILALAFAGHPGRALAQTVEYQNGRAWNDERTQTMTLAFTGGGVSGTMTTAALCGRPDILWGGTFAISAQLLGPWEDRGSVIRGTWSGTIDTCSGAFPDSGEVEISMAADPFNNLSVRVILSGGAVYKDDYGYYYPPHNQVFVAGPAQSVEARYVGGQAWMDARGQSMRLNFAGERVLGDLDTTSICSADTGLGGIYQRLDGTLRGNWEGWGSLIFGTWGGDNKFCNTATTPDRGHMCIFIGAGRQSEPAIVVRSVDENGQTYHYSYTTFKSQVLDLGLSPAANAAGGVQAQLLYNEGKAWQFGINDGRTQTLALGIQGDRVFGTITVPAYCQQASLDGASVQFEGTLDGPWEAPGTTIIGWWSGYKSPCSGGETPDEGTLKISIGTTPEAASGVIVQMRSLANTEYAYYHPAKGQVATGFAGPADRFFSDAFQLCNFPLPGAPQIIDFCAYENDGKCDEPGAGTGLCPSGSDTDDCQSQPLDEANSCDLAFDDVCDDPGNCDPGTDTADCQTHPPDLANGCDYANNGVCEEPDYCDPGTDTADCSGQPPVDTANSCPYANNGACEEATGACASGTDTNDCQNQPPIDVANSCSTANNGQCDVPGSCAEGTDTADCSASPPQETGCTALWNGTWNSSYGDMTISAGGSSASGSYVTRDTEPAQGSVTGTLSADGCEFTGKWEQAATPNHAGSSGDFRFTMADDGKSWSGGWNYASGGSGGGWNAERIGQ